MVALQTVTRRRGHELRKLKAFANNLAASKRYSVNHQINQTDLLAHTNQELVVEHDGFLVGFDTTTQVAITTGGTLKVQLNTVDVPGATVTHGNGDTVGTRKTASFTPIAVLKGDRITLVPASHATAGAVNCSLGFTAN